MNTIGLVKMAANYLVQLSESKMKERLFQASRYRTGNQSLKTDYCFSRNFINELTETN